jgi:hypothetical protein
VIHIIIIGFRILVAGVVITTIVIVTNLDAVIAAAKLINAKGTVQAALVTAGLSSAFFYYLSYLFLFLILFCTYNFFG